VLCRHLCESLRHSPLNKTRQAVIVSVEELLIMSTAKLPPDRREEIVNQVSYRRCVAQYLKVDEANVDWNAILYWKFDLICTDSNTQALTSSFLNIMLLFQHCKHAKNVHDNDNSEKFPSQLTSPWQIVAYGSATSLPTVLSNSSSRLLFK
jgi:hypothetical protein